MYKNIINPITKKKTLINSKSGIKILKKYLKYYNLHKKQTKLSGGAPAADDDVSDDVPECEICMGEINDSDGLQVEGEHVCKGCFLHQHKLIAGPTETNDRPTPEETRQMEETMRQMEETMRQIRAIKPDMKNGSYYIAGRRHYYATPFLSNGLSIDVINREIKKYRNAKKSKEASKIFMRLLPYLRIGKDEDIKKGTKVQFFKNNLWHSATVKKVVQNTVTYCIVNDDISEAAAEAEAECKNVDISQVRLEVDLMQIYEFTDHKQPMPSYPDGKLDHLELDKGIEHIRSTFSGRDSSNICYCPKCGLPFTFVGCLNLNTHNTNRLTIPASVYEVLSDKLKHTLKANIHHQGQLAGFEVIYGREGIVINNPHDNFRKFLEKNGIEFADVHNITQTRNNCARCKFDFSKLTYPVTTEVYKGALNLGSVLPRLDAFSARGISLARKISTNRIRSELVKWCRLWFGDVNAYMFYFFSFQKLIVSGRFDNLTHLQLLDKLYQEIYLNTEYIQKLQYYSKTPWGNGNIAKIKEQFMSISARTILYLLLKDHTPTMIQFIILNGNENILNMRASDLCAVENLHQGTSPHVANNLIYRLVKMWKLLVDQTNVSLSNSINFLPMIIILFLPNDDLLQTVFKEIYASYQNINPAYAEMFKTKCEEYIKEYGKAPLDWSKDVKSPLSTTQAQRQAQPQAQRQVQPQAPRPRNRQSLFAQRRRRAQHQSPRPRNRQSLFAQRRGRAQHQAPQRSFAQRLQIMQTRREARDELYRQRAAEQELQSRINQQLLQEQRDRYRAQQAALQPTAAQPAAVQPAVAQRVAAQQADIIARKKANNIRKYRIWEEEEKKRAKSWCPTNNCTILG